MVDILYTAKILLFSYLWYKYGFIYSILLIYLLNFLIDLILQLFFGYERLCGLAKTFIETKEEKKFTMTGYILLDDYKPEEWKNMIIKRGVDAFPKLRKVVTKLLGNYYWKDVDCTLAYNNLKNFKNIRLNSLEDICNYTIKEQEIHYKLNEIPWELHFIRYGEKGGMIFIKLDHALSDGIGFIGLIIALADNYSLNLFPQAKSPSLYMQFLVFLSRPFYAIYLTYLTMKVKHKNSPFKLETSAIESYNKRGNKRMYISKRFDFNKLSSIYKNKGLTFNEFIMCLIVKNYKNYAEELEKKLNTKYDLSTITSNMAISLRSMPKDLNSCEINNNIGAITMEIPVIDNIEKDYIKVKNTIDYYIKSPLTLHGSKFLQDFVSNLLSENTMNKAVEDNSKLVDTITSNVPGPRSELFYIGCKVLSIMASPQPGPISNNITIMSYNGEFSIAGCSFDKVPLNIQVLIKMIENDIDTYLNNIKN